MNNQIKVVLIGILFCAVVAAAYVAGVYSGGDTSYPPTSRSSEEARDTEKPHKVDDIGNDMPWDRSSSGGMGTAATTEMDAKPERINVEDYETLDGTPKVSDSFRPDPYVLKREFPDNLALPPATREEFIEKEKQRERRNREYGKIAANQATPEEIEAYYSEQARLAEDSIEILLFLLTEYSDEMSREDLLKHEFLVERFQKRLELIPERKADALKRLKQ